MSNPDQKRIWREEKEQQLRDKQNQPREVRRRAVSLSFGGLTKKRIEIVDKEQKRSNSSNDEFLRRQLGI